MMEVIWSAVAEADLESIVDYIARDNLMAALVLDDLLRNTAQDLAFFPKKGKPGRHPGTRELVAHEHYLLVYTVTGETVHIVTVVHTSRKFP